MKKKLKAKRTVKINRDLLLSRIKELEEGIVNSTGAAIENSELRSEALLLRAKNTDLTLELDRLKRALVTTNDRLYRYDNETPAEIIKRGIILFFKKIINCLSRRINEK